MTFTPRQARRAAAVPWLNHRHGKGHAPTNDNPFERGFEQ